MNDPKEVEAVALGMRNAMRVESGQEPLADFGQVFSDYWHKRAKAALAALAPFRAAEREALQSELAAVTAERDAMREALSTAEGAMREMFRYYDGGETRGSYDGKPERSGLRKAWYAARAALAKIGATQ